MLLMVPCLSEVLRRELETSPQNGEVLYDAYDCPSSWPYGRAGTHR